MLPRRDRQNVAVIAAGASVSLTQLNRMESGVNSAFSRYRLIDRWKRLLGSPFLADGTGVAQRRESGKVLPVRMKTKIFGLLVAGLWPITGLAVPTFTSVTYDEVLYQADPTVTAALLSAQVSMGVDGGFLYVRLRNVSPDTALTGSEHGNLGVLSGLAFNLPAGVGIGFGGDAYNAPGSMFASGGSAALMQSAWGWDYSGGALLSGGALAEATLSYNARGATIASDGKHSFSDTSSSRSNPNAGGLDYGAKSALESLAPGNAHVTDSVELKFLLTGTAPADLVGYIDSHSVAVYFASPTDCRVPDGGTTVALLGGAVVTLGALRRFMTR